MFQKPPNIELLNDVSLVLVGFSISNMARLWELCRVARQLPFDISSVSVDAVFPTIYGFKFDFYLKAEDKKIIWKLFF